MTWDDILIEKKYLAIVYHSSSSCDFCSAIYFTKVSNTSKLYRYGGHDCDSIGYHLDDYCFIGIRWYSKSPVFEGKPITSYIQVLNIAVYFVGGILILCF
jgi:hypothetical protein